MENLEKRIFKTAALFIFAVITISIILKRYDIMMGFFAGGVISLINFQLLKLNIKNLIGAKGGFRYIMFFIGYLSRYLLMAAALWVSINKGFGYFWSLAAGLFVIRAAIFINGLKPCKKPAG
jgi:hypothetical protein